jgi:hypothetical protein
MVRKGSVCSSRLFKKIFRAVLGRREKGERVFGVS